MSAERYRKHFIPLESDPDIFTHLMHKLGVSSALSFKDVWTLDDPALLPRPALALILIFPTSEAYESQKAEEDAKWWEHKGDAGKEGIIWFEQTINNACGLYAILHAVCNGSARNFIKRQSFLGNLLQTSQDRVLALENSEELASAYATAAMQGCSAVPTNAEAEVDSHFICLTKPEKSSHIYELDGDRKGPIDRGVLLGPNDDMLGKGGRDIVRKFIQREKGENLSFNLLALVERSG